MNLQLQDAVRPAARLMSMAGGLETEQTLCADVRLGTGAWANSNRNVGAGTAEAQAQWMGSVTLGMPQLSGVGLSETWLLETSGDLHWSMVCHRLGAPSHELRDALGRRVYISFVAVRVTSECMDQFMEGDLLHYASSLIQCSPTRFESLHSWQCGSKTVEVEMLSIFLRRREDGGNALEEAQPARASEPGMGADATDLERAFRHQMWKRGGRKAVQHECSWQPTLALDYNGAGLLYFARYHQIVERAEASVAGESADVSYALQRRETYYFANLDAGESVTVGLSEISSAGRPRQHQAEIRRSRDGRLMARIITVKKRRASAGKGPAGQFGTVPLTAGAVV
jgi:probable biosynthetic protein (TIGR04099 family)